MTCLTSLRVSVFTVTLSLFRCHKLGENGMSKKSEKIILSEYKNKKKEIDKNWVGKKVLK